MVGRSKRRGIKGKALCGDSAGVDTSIVMKIWKTLLRDMTKVISSIMMIQVFISKSLQNVLSSFLAT